MRTKRNNTLAVSSVVALFCALGISAGEPGSPPYGVPGTPPERPRARDGSPNILVLMLDDVGFAQLGCYGGLVSTPNIDRVAATGIRYGNYHATPVCSASRAAFLTGRNSHTVHEGGHLFAPRGLPGYDGLVPASAGTVAENLRQGGYLTFALGKWDHLLPSDTTPAGPFTYWPTHQGFDHYYGFLFALTDNWNPMLWSDTTPVPRPSGPNYHLTQDLTDQAISLINSRSAHVPAAPFFLYLAPGAAHAPHHAPADWIARYKGKFDAGWDVAREQSLKREISEGIVAAGTKLAPRPDVMKAWKDLSADEKRLYAREMEVFAASLSYADAEFGRVLDTLQQRAELDNTIVVVTSDNGASAEGGVNGLSNEAALLNGHSPSVAENLRWYDKWGGPETSPHYAIGWAVAGDTPFRYYKGTTFEGGVRTPLIISWPKRILARGEWRGQFAHITDLTPTILDAAGVNAAAVVNGVPQSPFDGHSIVSTFGSPEAPSPDHAQYFELYGNKGLWADGWKLVTAHKVDMWNIFGSKPLDDPWQLYNLETDPGERDDLASSQPRKVAQLDAVFREQARRFHVDPIGDISAARAYAAALKTQAFARRGGRWLYPAPVARLPDAEAPPIAWRNYTMTASVDLPQGNETGPVFAFGGAHSGMSFYLIDGRPAFAVRSYNGELTSLESPSALARGHHALVLQVTHAAAEIDGIRVRISADGRVLVAQSMAVSLPKSSGAESFDIGRDDGTAVVPAYPAATPFPGSLKDVLFDFNANDVASESK